MRVGCEFAGCGYRMYLGLAIRNTSRYPQPKLTSAVAAEGGTDDHDVMNTPDIDFSATLMPGSG
jgi:hypothetical protein